MATAAKSVIILVADEKRFLLSTVRQAVGLIDDPKLNIRCLFARTSAEITAHLDGSTAIDLLILNRLAEDASGLEVLKRIRCGVMGVSQMLPVLLVIGHGDPKFVQLASALDVNTILVRPTSLRFLADRIQYALSHPIDPRETEHYRHVRLPKAISVAPDVHRAPGILLHGSLRPKQETNADNDKRTLWVGVETLRVGMKVAQDVRGPSGSLVVGKDVRLTQRLVSRLNELFTHAPERNTIKIYYISHTQISTERQ